MSNLKALLKGMTEIAKSEGKGHMIVLKVAQFLNNDVYDFLERLEYEEGLNPESDIRYGLAA